MKISLSFSSSPSSVSSSTTTNSTETSVFDANLCNSHNGCLSGVLRRLLCGGGLRTHPFDCIKESNGVNHGANKKVITEEEELESATMTPGLVARLMGLDSMPDSNSALRRRPVPDSIGRSRSVNSADYWSEFDPTQGQPRRVKSFREMPTFLQSENDEFLVLSFEKNGEGRRDRREAHVELKIESPVKKELPSERSKLGELERKKAKKMKSRKKQSIACAEENRGAECDSENSSPVSVLDLDEFLLKTNSIESDEKPRLANSNSRRDLSLELTKSEQPSSNFVDSSKISEEPIVKNKNCDDHKKKDELELWGVICKLAEKEILNSSWVNRGVWRSEEFEEIENDFAVEILDKLVNEAATEMMEELYVGC